MTKQRNVQSKKKTEDTVVLKVMIALALLIFSIYMLRLVAQVYGTLAGFDTIRPALLYITPILLGLTVICLVLCLVLKNRNARALLAHAAAVLALFFVDALVLRLTWNHHIRELYVLDAAVFGLYIVYQLYRAEFFFFSLVTGTAAAVFYFFSTGFGPNLRSFLMGGLLLAFIVVTALIANMTWRNRGVLSVFGKKLPLFPAKFTPLVLYIACALWLVCLIAVVVLGPTFSYYCMFATVALELIAAVYYTFQLK